MSSFESEVKLKVILAIKCSSIDLMTSNKSPLLMATCLWAIPIVHKCFHDEQFFLASLLWLAVRTTISLFKAVQKGPLLAMFSVITIPAVTAFAVVLWPSEPDRDRDRDHDHDHTVDRRSTSLLILVRIPSDL